MLGTFLLEKTYAHVLFDSSASHSFVTPEFAKKLSRYPFKMEHVLCVNTLVGSVLCTNVIFRTCPLNVSGKNLLIDLVKIEMQGFDVILGMTG